jgi:hypothetical protein
MRPSSVVQTVSTYCKTCSLQSAKILHYSYVNNLKKGNNTFEGKFIKHYFITIFNSLKCYTKTADHGGLIGCGFCK